MHDHPIMTAWFIILLITGFWGALYLIEYASTIENPLITPSRGDIIFVLFFFIFVKSTVEMSDNTLRNKKLKHLFSSPISIRGILYVRFLKIFWYNMLLVALSASIVSLLVPLFDISLPIDYFFFPHLYALFLLAPLVGTNLAVISHLKSIPKRLVGIAVYGQIITLVWRITHINILATTFFIYVGILTTLSLAVLFLIPPLFLESWKKGVTTATESPLRLHQAGDFLPQRIPKAIRRVAEKEILIRWRRREAPASIGIVVLIGVALLYFLHLLGPKPDLDLGLGKYFYPILIGMSLYLAVVLQTVIPSLSLFGREGSRLWVLKTLPVKSTDIVWGKTISMLFYTPLIPLAIAIPLPLILGYPPLLVLFSFFVSVVMIFSFTGLGVWAGSRFPNFNEEVDGAPDVMTMYTILIACLIVGAVLTAYPMFVFQIDRIVGVLTIIFSADVSALILHLLVDNSAKSYESIEVDM